jgi:hypothetical protein
MSGTKRNDASLPGMALLLAVTLAVGAKLLEQAWASSAASPFQLDFADDGKQLKLLVRHAEIGLVCELWCYEAGSFQYGKGSKSGDGSVVFIHTSGKMTATTRFTPSGESRVSMDVSVQGPIEELKKVVYMGPCMQLWHSEKFKREDSLVDFARRCFLYTMRGPVGMLDTARGPMKGFKPDGPENNPPYTQWYVPIGRVHPGDIWAFGASGDRPLYGIVGAVSRDGRWVAAIGCAHTRTLGQGWHDCIHYVPEMQAYLDERKGQLLQRTTLYVMPNDKRRLLENFQQDFPQRQDSQIRVSPGKGGTLSIRSGSQNVSGVELSLNVVSSGRKQDEQQGPSWQISPWGGFVRRGPSWRMWAFPTSETLELWVSLADGAELGKVQAELASKVWTLSQPPKEAPVLVRRAPDGSLTAIFMWEKSEEGKPALGIPSPSNNNAGVKVLRGRLYLQDGKLETLRDRWIEAKENWQHSTPYRMPVEE